MAEAAGFVLAAVPICIGVVEKYSEVARLLRRFRKYDEQATYVSQAIGIHKSIYRNTIRILLGSIVSEDESHQMLADPAHPLWKDAYIDDEIAARLSDSRDAFIDAGSAIMDKLTALEKFCYECHDQVSRAKNGSERNPWLKAKMAAPDPKEEVATKRLLRKGIRDKVKFAFAEPQIESLITAISRLTQEMQTLVQQTEQTYKQKSLSQPSIATKRRIEKFSAVKGAAENLYRALSHACTVHAEHQAHLSLHPLHNDSSQVQFTLAMRHSAPTTAAAVPANQPRLWLTVESIVSGTLQSSNDSEILGELHPREKRRREVDPPSDEPSSPSEGIPCPSVKTKKRVQFAPAVSSVIPPPPLYMKQLDVLPNFCTNENFCTQLHKISRESCKGPVTCVGYLELSGSSKHLVYLKSAAQTIKTSISAPMVALKDLFAPTYRATLPCGGLLPHDRIRIAKHLALAVLQFQATPWLERPWTSSEVSIFSLPSESATGTDADMNGPFLDVSIKNSLEPSTKSVNLPSRILIRNRLLFGLGVMMLELAFQQPLAVLRRAQDLDQHQDQNTDYFTADRIRHQASAYLGPRYAEVARKCIQCDFGHGSDLNEIRLQEGFYQDVICELEALEKTFREFRLSI